MMQFVMIGCKTPMNATEKLTTKDGTRATDTRKFRSLTPDQTWHVRSVGFVIIPKDQKSGTIKGDQTSFHLSISSSV